MWNKKALFTPRKLKLAKWLAHLALSSAVTCRIDWCCVWELKTWAAELCRGVVCLNAAFISFGKNHLGITSRSNTAT